MSPVITHPLLLLFLICIGAQVYASSELNPIIVGGNMLFDTVTSDRFYVKGMTYGYEVEDSYVQYWKQAMDNIASINGVNTVRIYNVNPAINIPPNFVVNTSYDDFMHYMQSKGLYVIVPLTPPGIAPWGNCPLNRAGLPPLNSTNTCYPSCLLSYAQSVINVFSKYTNTLSYIVGNEVMNTDLSWAAAPCVKAFARDVKAYMRSCKHAMRPVPLTYAAADVPGGKKHLSAEAMDGLKAQYLQCEGGQTAIEGGETAIDMYGLNLYRWCSDQASFASVYAKLQSYLEDLSIPVIMTEFDCDNFVYHLNGTAHIGQRDWKAMTELLSPTMSSVFSGGTAYSYGVEGGTGFAMYLGGSTDPAASPGYNKSCGYPNGVCGIDNFAAALAAGVCTPNHPEGTNVCAWKPSGYNRTIPSCPTPEELPDGVGDIPDTRQGAPGYIPISCPNHNLSPVEIVVTDCQAPYKPTPGGSDNFFSSKTFYTLCSVAGGLAVLGLVMCAVKHFRKQTGDQYDPL